MSNIGFKEDFNNSMMFSAYTAWQINETIKAVLTGSNSGLTFNRYLKSLGLLKESDNQPKKAQTNVEQEKQKALAIADKIVKLHKKGREKRA